MHSLRAIEEILPMAAPPPTPYWDGGSIILISNDKLVSFVNLNHFMRGWSQETIHGESSLCAEYIRRLHRPVWGMLKYLVNSFLEDYCGIFLHSPPNSDFFLKILISQFPKYINFVWHKRTSYGYVGMACQLLLEKIHFKSWCQWRSDQHSKLCYLNKKNCAALLWPVIIIP